MSVVDEESTDFVETNDFEKLVGFEGRLERIVSVGVLNGTSMDRGFDGLFETGSFETGLFGFVRTEFVLELFVPSEFVRTEFVRNGVVLGKFAPSGSVPWEVVLELCSLVSGWFE